MRPVILLLEAGHGATGPDGVYFEEGKQSPDGKFREGDYNREVADDIVTHFRGENMENTIFTNYYHQQSRYLPQQVEVMISNYLDWPVDARVKMIDKFVVKYPKHSVVHVSLHCNADGDDTPKVWGRAQGARMFVRKNANKNSLALAVELEKSFKEGPYLDLCTGTIQKSWLRKANFTVLSQKAHASVLLEMGFMDNKDNLNLLLSKRPVIVTAVASAVESFIQRESMSL